MARELGIALGMANTYLKRCVRRAISKFARFLQSIQLLPDAQRVQRKIRLTAEYFMRPLPFFVVRKINALNPWESPKVRRLASCCALVGVGKILRTLRVIAQSSIQSIPSRYSRQQDRKNYVYGPNIAPTIADLAWTHSSVRMRSTRESIQAIADRFLPTVS